MDEDQPQHSDSEPVRCCSGTPAPVAPDPKDRDASGIMAVDDCVMTENEFPEPRWSVLDWTSHLGEVTDASECTLENLAIGRAFAGAPLSLGVIQDVFKLTQCTRGKNDLNT